MDKLHVRELTQPLRPDSSFDWCMELESTDALPSYQHPMLLQDARLVFMHTIVWHKGPHRK